MTTYQKHDHGVGYAHDEFAGTTVPREELERLARLVFEPQGAYKYERPREDDDAPLRPCNYLPSLDDALRRDLVRVGNWPQACAITEMLACQISQTGWARDRRANDEEREWADVTFAGSRAKQQLRRVSGTCTGCNSSPCRCIAGPHEADL